MLDRALSDIEKEAQKMMIRVSVGSTAIAKSLSNISSINKSTKYLFGELKQNINETSQNMGNSLKGEYGSKVKTVLKNQSKKLDSF